MNTYYLAFELLPSYAFGIPTPDHHVVPGGDQFSVHWDNTSGYVYFTRSDGTDTSRRTDERFLFEFSADGISFAIKDNVCRAIAMDANQDSAAERASDCLSFLFLLHSALNESMHILISPALRMVFPNEPEGDRLQYLPMRNFFVYDNRELAFSLASTAFSMNETKLDHTMRRSLRYLGLGDALVSLLPPDGPDDQNWIVQPLRFLQYWKALATIVGDPSRAKDHQSRPQRLGLDRTFFRQRVKPMHDIRNSFDVAHIDDDNDGRRVTAEDATECRVVATTTMRAYFQWLQESGRRGS